VAQERSGETADPERFAVAACESFDGEDFLRRGRRCRSGEAAAQCVWIVGRVEGGACRVVDRQTASFKDGVDGFAQGLLWSFVPPLATDLVEILIALALEQSESGRRGRDLWKWVVAETQDECTEAAFGPRVFAISVIAPAAVHRFVADEVRRIEPSFTADGIAL
jgi:hypothetical protein